MITSHRQQKTILTAIMISVVIVLTLMHLWIFGPLDISSYMLGGIVAFWIEVTIRVADGMRNG